MSGAWPWPAPHDDGGVEHLREGVAVPAGIELPATDDRSIDLSAISGRAILVIYPWTGEPGGTNPPGWDDIPGAHGSTPQLEGFARLFDPLVAIGCTVVGVSGQAVEEQRAFAARTKLPFPLASDAGGQFRQSLNLPTFRAGDQTYLTRLTISATDGVVDQVFYPVHPPNANAREVLAWANARGKRD